MADNLTGDHAIECRGAQTEGSAQLGWSGPGGVREVIRVAVPLAVSMVAWSIMHFIDRIFLMWHSEEAVAAALPAGTLHFVATCFPLGVAMYASTFVAQYFGAGRFERTGLATWQGVFVGLAALPLIVFTNPLADWLFASVGHPADVAVLEMEYYRALSYGGGAMVMGAAISAFFMGRGNMKTVMVVDSSAAALNVALDYVWIFGSAGFPAWGVAGAAWATTASQWARLAIYLVLFLMPAMRREFGTWAGLRFDAPLMGRLLWFGFPNGVQFVLECASFAIFLLLVGRLGGDAMTASSLAFSVNHLAFMPVLGLGMAVATLVGQRLGDNQPDLAARSVWSGFALAATYTAAIGAVYLFLPEMLFLAHRAEIDPERFEYLQGLVIVLLRFVALYCLFDTMNVIFSFAIKGAGDTRFVMLTTILTAGLPVGLTWFGVGVLGYGLFWAWGSITVWILLLGVIYLARFLQGKWRAMRVIEAAAPGLEQLPSSATPVTAEPALETTAS